MQDIVLGSELLISYCIHIFEVMEKNPQQLVRSDLVETAWISHLSLFFLTLLHIAEVLRHLYVQSSLKVSPHISLVKIWSGLQSVHVLWEENLCRVCFLQKMLQCIRTKYFYISLIFSNCIFPEAVRFMQLCKVLTVSSGSPFISSNPNLFSLFLN